MKTKTDAYQVITDRIIAQLEKGVVPWRKPWVGGGAPKNLVSGKEYRGINLLMLADGETPYWVTYKQAQDLGGQVRRGEKGTPVVFWQMLEKENAETGEMTNIPMARYYTVFNISQCDGLTAPDEQTTFDHAPIKRAENIVNNMPNRPEIKTGNQASYRPLADIVTMPAKNTFTSPEGYYATLYHELGHSTLHASRLDRENKNYAKEELVAELTAAYLCGQSGITPQTIDNASSYIASWLQSLRNDHKMIIQAASLAQKATDYILGKIEIAEERKAA